jgi:hypothetical protein
MGAPMMDENRIYSVMRLISDYAQWPSLRHIRDPYSLRKLARDIARHMGQANSIWKKWNGQREVLATSAAECWIPIEDLTIGLRLGPC